MFKLIEKVKIDMWLFAPLFIISSFGLMVLYSASNQSLEVVESQFFKLFIGFVLMIFVSQINPNKIRIFSPKLYCVVVFMLILVPIIGNRVLGATRWLDLGIISIQPSEIMKLALPMMLAWMIFKKGMPRKLTTSIWFSFLIMLPVMFVLTQPDLGTSILIIASGLFLLFQAGLSYMFIFYSVSIIISCIPFLWFLLKDYQQQRILTLFDPESDPLNTGYHIIQSKIAIGSGGLNGKGFLEGTQSHLGFIPEQRTDFIFAVLSEEMGFKWFILLVSLYLLVIWRLYHIILKTNDMYEKLVTGSIMMVFSSYIFVNIGMVSGILPVVGVPLPLISFGGTSVVVLLASFGVVSSFVVHNSEDRRYISRLN